MDLSEHFLHLLLQPWVLCSVHCLKYLKPWTYMYGFTIDYSNMVDGIAVTSHQSGLCMVDFKFDLWWCLGKFDCSFTFMPTSQQSIVIYIYQTFQCWDECPSDANYPSLYDTSIPDYKTATRLSVPIITRSKLRLSELNKTLIFGEPSLRVMFSFFGLK